MIKTLYLLIIHLFGDIQKNHKNENVKLVVSSVLDNMYGIRNTIQKYKQRWVTMVSDPNGALLCGFSVGINVMRNLKKNTDEL